MDHPLTPSVCVPPLAQSPPHRPGSLPPMLNLNPSAKRSQYERQTLSAGSPSTCALNCAPESFATAPFGYSTRRIFPALGSSTTETWFSPKLNLAPDSHWLSQLELVNFPSQTRERPLPQLEVGDGNCGAGG